MASGVSIKVEGLDKVIQKIGSIPESVTQEVDVQMAMIANEFVNRAVADAPVYEGILKNEITFERRGDMDYVIVSGVEYSAFVEFGTRGRVNIPPGLEEYASQFRGAGKGAKDVKQTIFDWCKKKGIDQKLWQAIFIKIMTQGIEAHPFFFKQLPQAQADVLKNLQPAVQKALSK